MRQHEGLLWGAMMKKSFLIAILVMIAALFVAKASASGVAFTLTNVGTTTMESITVQVTGRSYPLGDLTPGASKTIRLKPTGESRIDLVFSGSRRLAIDCYFESGYKGEIAAEVTPQKVVSVKSDLKFGIDYGKWGQT
jgi:hypothetical protein